MPPPGRRAPWSDAQDHVWARERARFDRMLQGFGARLVDAAELAPGDRVIDVGCGAGDTLMAMAARVGPAGLALGIDTSARLLAQARARLAPQACAMLVCAAAETHDPGAGAFDAVASRLGMTFFGDMDRALRNVRRALRSGGRLVFVCWQGLRANEWMRAPWEAVAVHVRVPEAPAPAGPGPFALADPARIRAVLDRAGFRDVVIAPLIERVPVGADIEDATGFFGRDAIRAVLDAVPAATAGAFVATLRQALAPHASPDGVYLGAAAWLVSARA